MAALGLDSIKFDSRVTLFKYQLMLKTFNKQASEVRPEGFSAFHSPHLWTDSVSVQSALPQ